MRGEGDEKFEMSSLNLLRCALAQSDEDAWTGFQQCLEETVLTWLHRHSGKEPACRGLCEKHLVAQVFERFRQSAIQEQMEFETLASVLIYLQANLLGVILDTLRTISRPGAVLSPVPGQVGEPRLADQIDSNEIWEALQTLMLNARERRLVYLLYHCGLRPREILHFCPQEWSDIQEIYRLRRNILERLLAFEEERNRKTG